MNGQLLTVQDLTSGLFTPQELFKLIWGLNYQALYHYNRSPWVEHGYSTPAQSVVLLPKGATAPEGSWHIELLDTSDQEGALGYHENEAFDSKLEGVEQDYRGPTRHPRKASARSSRGLRVDNPELPLAKVFVKTSQEDGVAPSEVASHEMLEMLVDPRVVNEAEIRKYLDEKTHQWYIAEVGDPVQGEGYDVGIVEGHTTGVIVANFAWPAWWGQAQTRKQLDFRGTRKQPFELAPGGYMSVAPEASPREWSQIYGAKS